LEWDGVDRRVNGILDIGGCGRAGIDTKVVRQFLQLENVPDELITASWDGQDVLMLVRTLFECLP
jgi:hypothetical protein